MEKKKIKDEIPGSIEKCQEAVKEIFQSSSDIVIDTFETIKGMAMLVYVDGLIDKNLVDRDIIAPLKSINFEGDISAAIRCTIADVDNMSSVTGQVLQGNTAVFFEGRKKVAIADLKSFQMRSVEPPDAEASIRGPKEGFTENLRTNTSLLRRKIRTPDLIMENITIGRQTNTVITLAYIRGIVNTDVLDKVKYRLSKIDVDSIMESGYIEQYITENGFSTISGIGITQKPDVAAAKILEGRVAVICDGTPHVLTIPELFIENIQTAEDYYNRTILSSLLRLLRVLGLFISVMLPGLSVAVITYNQEMMPAVFFQNLIVSTAKTPLPAGAEIFLLILMFELLREAGTRLPKAVGSAITIVGALIIGEAAVNAGIVSAPAVIIVALTAVTSFIIPNLTEFTLVYRLILLFLGGSMGLIGIGAGMVIMLTQLISTTSFGISLLDSFSKPEFKDSAIRFPLWSLKLRPLSIARDNIVRKKENK
ncbi:MAG: spore germination protein [Clostridiales bacterium]|jgi:spore germination protein KA|nr:spore germination protein [Clostridiales bacterium]